MSAFQDTLKLNMHLHVKEVYAVTKSFPRDELYGVTSQLRRAAMSVILNYIGGFARFRPKVKRQFYETSYGSLKESKYLVYFIFTEGYITKEAYQSLLHKAEEIGKMLWSEIELVRSE